jgi:hypothetical protein
MYKKLANVLLFAMILLGGQLKAYDSETKVDTNNTSTSTSTVTSTNTNNNTNNNINDTTVNSTSTSTNNNINTSTSTNTNNNNNVNTSTSTNTNNNNNVNTTTSNNTNTNVNTSTNTNYNVNSGEQTFNNNNVNDTKINSSNVNTNTNVNTSTSNNTNANTNNNTKVEQPPPTAIAPSMMSGGNNDLCTTGTSGAVQTQILGVSSGGTIRDQNCERLKNAKTLFDMGMKVAAVSVLCQDRRVFDAMWNAGTPCPYEGNIGEQAKISWSDNPDKIPQPEKPQTDDFYKKTGFGALLGYLLFIL